MAPQVTGAPRQFLVPAKLFVELKSHTGLPISDCRLPIRLSIAYFTSLLAAKAAIVSASDSQAARSPMRL